MGLDIYGKVAYGLLVPAEKIVKTRVVPNCEHDTPGPNFCNICGKPKGTRIEREVPDWFHSRKFGEFDVAASCAGDRVEFVVVGKIMADVPNLMYGAKPLEIPSATESPMARAITEVSIRTALVGAGITDLNEARFGYWFMPFVSC